MLKNSIAGLLFLLVATSALADEHVLKALASTSETWKGELYYLDCQSDQRFSIPMQAEIDATPDGPTVIRQTTWTDPNNLVYAVQLTTVDSDSGELVEAFFRDGKGENMRYAIVAVEIESMAQWEIIYEHDGTDADRPAQIRHTVKRDGNQMKSTKSIDFLDSKEVVFFERNRSNLKLTDAIKPIDPKKDPKKDPR